MRLGLWAGLLGVALLSVGCAGLPLLQGVAAPDFGHEIRPDAPAEYDLLVAQHHDADGRLVDAVAALERAVAKDPDSAYLQYELAEALARSNRPDEAIEHGRRSLVLDPDSHRARSLLAHLFRIRREPAAAAEVLLDDEGKPFDSETGFLLYQIYLESGRFEDALAVAEWMVEHEPENVRARIALANAYERLGRPVDAERVLQDALELAPDNLRIYTALASSKRERGDREGEIAVYREILKGHSDDHGTLVALADAQTAENDLGGAIETLERIERRYGSDLRSVLRLGFLLYEARRFTAAAERFERVLEASPDEHEIAFFLGVSRSRARMEDAALEAFLSIPPDHKHYAQARWQIAAIHERRGAYGAALEEIDRALVRERSRELELYGVQLRAKSGDFSGAVESLEELIQSEPENDQLVYNLGVVYGEDERHDEALDYMQRALELNPDNASALNYIGYSWAERGENLDEAERMIVRAIELRPGDGYIVDSLGWVYHMRARPLLEAGKDDRARHYIDRALEQLERADELTGGDPVISEHLGDTYLLLNERRRALDKFEEAAGLGIRKDEQPKLFEKLETLRRELR